MKVYAGPGRTRNPLIGLNFARFSNSNPVVAGT